jgi:hypothetical protein
VKNIMNSNTMNEGKYKYPRTPHLPWSPGWTSDDVRKTSVDQFIGKEIVITEKMDGENTTMYTNYIHARSIDSRHHRSRDWVKRLHATLKCNIPQGWRLCGENLYAKHAIHYYALPSYFLLFSIWDENNDCLSWDQTLEWAEILGLNTPAILYRGLWNQAWFDKFSIETDQCEGYVVRLSEGYHYDEFTQCVAKWVRASHVQSDKHWMHAAIIANHMIKSKETNTGGDHE